MDFYHNYNKNKNYIIIMGVIYSKFKEWKQNRRNKGKTMSNDVNCETNQVKQLSMEQSRLLSSYMGNFGSSSFCSNILGNDMKDIITE